MSRRNFVADCIVTQVDKDILSQCFSEGYFLWSVEFLLSACFKMKGKSVGLFGGSIVCYYELHDAFPFTAVR